MDRLLDHGLVAIQRQQLLGPPLTAKRPEAGATASGENYGIEVVLCVFQNNPKPLVILSEVDALRQQSIYEVEGPLQIRKYRSRFREFCQLSARGRNALRRYMHRNYFQGSFDST
jgi:hypothetical protein